MHSLRLSITFVRLGLGVAKNPQRAAASPLINLYMPETQLLQPGDKVILSFGVGFRFPRNVVGLLSLKPNFASKLRMQPQVIGENNFALPCPNVRQFYFYRKLSKVQNGSGTRGESLYLV